MPSHNSAEQHQRTVGRRRAALVLDLVEQADDVLAPDFVNRQVADLAEHGAFQRHPPPMRRSKLAAFAAVVFLGDRPERVRELPRSLLRLLGCGRVDALRDLIHGVSGQLARLRQADARLQGELARPPAMPVVNGERFHARWLHDHAQPPLASIDHLAALRAGPEALDRLCRQHLRHGRPPGLHRGIS
jgi:hypothetical protein